MNYQRDVTEERAYQVYRIKQARTLLDQAIDCPILHDLAKVIEKATDMMEGRDRLVEIDAQVFVKGFMNQYDKQLQPVIKGRAKLALVSSRA